MVLLLFRLSRSGPILLLFWVSVFSSADLEAAGLQQPRWWKGNLHTHSLWSDGDDYPEMIAESYKARGYHFLMFSDHNTLSTGTRWSEVRTNRGGLPAFDNYLRRFGDSWVERRMEGDKLWVRLKPLAEFAPLLDEPARFLLIQGEEISARHLTAPVHINVTNIRELIQPRTGDSVLAVIQSNVDAALEQRERTGQPMFPHLNHPNFGWGVTAEELMQVKGERFFEVYNGHPQVHNEGDATHASADRIWDIVLTRRLTELKLPLLYGLATDDAHHYHTNAVGKSNTGRGWVMVRATHLTPEKIVHAMEAGDFYASSGVTLREVRREKNRLFVEIEAEPGVEYTTQFIGTRQGYNPANEPVRAPSGTALRVTHRYSEEVGAVLMRVRGAKATYLLRGDEIYVRAVVTSSKRKANPYVLGEFERAWVQPLVPEVTGSGKGVE